MLVLGGCRRAARAPLTRSTVALDTTVTIAVYDVQASTEVLDDCVQRIQHYESLFSRTRAGSDIYRLNTAGGAWVTVDAETRALMQQALDICRESGGKFDITVAPITSLWNFSSESPVVPDKAALAEAVTHVGYDKLEIDGDRVRLTDPAAGVDLGGVAKGYIADRLREYLVSQKVSGALIDLGGNVLAVGDKQGEAFRVGIRDPQDSAALAATVAAGALVAFSFTSVGGDLRQLRAGVHTGRGVLSSYSGSRERVSGEQRVGGGHHLVRAIGGGGYVVHHLLCVG